MAAIDVQFYDHELNHEDLIAQRIREACSEQVAEAYIASLCSIVRKGLSFSWEEFVLHALWADAKDYECNLTRKRLEVDVPLAEGFFRRQFELGSGFSLTEGKKGSSLSEEMGVSICLMIAEKVFELTEADWTPIPQEHKRKINDFRITAAADSVRIEVEAKGRCVDNPMHQKGLKEAAASIFEKKVAQRANQNTSIMLGVIAALAKDRSEPAAAYLLDPEPEGSQLEPHAQKLLSRHQFYVKALNVIMGRAHFQVSLHERTRMLVKLGNRCQVLDGEPLTKPSGETYQIHSNSFVSKCHVAGSIGTVIVTDGEESSLYYWGIKKDVLQLLAEQNHSAIREFRAKAGYVRDLYAKFDVKIREKDAKRLKADTDSKSSSSNLLGMKVTGKLFCSSSGIVFGKLEPC